MDEPFQLVDNHIFYILINKRKYELGVLNYVNSLTWVLIQQINR